MASGGTFLPGSSRVVSRQILAIARGLLAQPKLLLLDEPSLGLAPQMVDTVFQVIQRIHKNGVTAQPRGAESLPRWLTANPTVRRGNEMKLGNQEGLELPPLTRRDWIKVLVGIPIFVVIVLGVYIGGLVLADFIWP